MFQLDNHPSKLARATTVAKKRHAQTGTGTGTGTGTHTTWPFNFTYRCGNTLRRSVNNFRAMAGSGFAKDRGLPPSTKDVGM